MNKNAYRNAKGKALSESAEQNGQLTEGLKGKINVLNS